MIEFDVNKEKNFVVCVLDVKYCKLQKGRVCFEKVEFFQVHEAILAVISYAVASNAVSFNIQVHSYGVCSDCI